MLGGYRPLRDTAAMNTRSIRGLRVRTPTKKKVMAASTAQRGQTNTIVYGVKDSSAQRK